MSLSFRLAFRIFVVCQALLVIALPQMGCKGFRVKGSRVLDIELGCRAWGLHQDLPVITGEGNRKWKLPVYLELTGAGSYLWLARNEEVDPYSSPQITLYSSFHFHFHSF